MCDGFFHFSVHVWQSFEHWFNWWGRLLFPDHPFSMLTEMETVSLIRFCLIISLFFVGHCVNEGKAYLYIYNWIWVVLNITMSSMYRLRVKGYWKTGYEKLSHMVRLPACHLWPWKHKHLHKFASQTKIHMLAVLFLGSYPKHKPFSTELGSNSFH